VAVAWRSPACFALVPAGVEIQIRGLRDMRERIMFYNARMLAGQLKAGERYGKRNL
jgi:hypothetical protein